MDLGTNLVTHEIRTNPVRKERICWRGAIRGAVAILVAAEMQIIRRGLCLIKLIFYDSATRHEISETQLEKRAHP